MKDRTLKNQKKHINKTLKQFQLAKTMIQLSITGTVSVITASLSFYFCPGFSSQVIKDARSAISFVQTASGQKFHELEDFLKKQTQPEPKRDDTDIVLPSVDFETLREMDRTSSDGFLFLIRCSIIR